MMMGLCCHMSRHALWFDKGVSQVYRGLVGGFVRNKHSCRLASSPLSQI